jgi:hypothetical protein
MQLHVMSIRMSTAGSVALYSKRTRTTTKQSVTNIDVPQAAILHFGRCLVTFLNCVLCTRILDIPNTNIYLHTILALDFTSDILVTTILMIFLSFSGLYHAEGGISVYTAQIACVFPASNQ